MVRKVRIDLILTRKTLRLWLYHKRTVILLKVYQHDMPTGIPGLGTLCRLLSCYLICDFIIMGSSYLHSCRALLLPGNDSITVLHTKLD